MRCIAVPVAVLQELVEEAEALDQTLRVIRTRQVPAVSDCIGGLLFALRQVGQIYHDAVADEEGANHVVVLGSSTQRRADRGDGERDATAG
jgi:hypothetical protein